MSFTDADLTRLKNRQQALPEILIAHSTLDALIRRLEAAEAILNERLSHPYEPFRQAVSSPQKDVEAWRKEAGR